MWGSVARACAEVAPRNDLATAFLNGLAGSTMISMALFGVEKCLLGARGLGLGFLGIAGVCGGVLSWHLRRQGWPAGSNKAFCEMRKHNEL